MQIGIISRTSSYLVLLLILTGIYSFLSASNVLSIRFYFLSLLIKLVFIGLLFWNVHLLYKKNYKVVAYLLCLVGLVIIIFISEANKQVAFFPTFGDYQISATYYDSQNKSINSQSRIEYFRKDYGLNDTSEKDEKVEVFFEIFESREVIYPTYEELEKFEFVQYNNYNPT